MKQYLAIAILIFLAACNGNNKPTEDSSLIPEWSNIKAPDAITYKVDTVYPHDHTSFTQGLQLVNGKLYEGTGDYNNSALKIVNLKTGIADQIHKIGKNAADSTFGEGVTVLNDTIYQLTWTEHIVYVYTTKDITKPIKTFKWNSEGWGITNDGTNLIISDGSSNIYFVNPQTFQVQRTQSVESNQGPQDSLNELEYINGFVYANIWQTNFIVKIDPANGHIVGKMDLSGFKDKFFAGQNIPGRTDVLNGIAYDSVTKKFLVTGKRWPKMFELKF